MPILRFPTDRIVGTVSWLELGWPPMPARGDVEVPDGVMLHLSIQPIARMERAGDGIRYIHDDAHPVDLSFMAQMPPDRVTRLDLGRGLVPASVRHLPHLAGGLRSLYLDSTALDDGAIPHIARLQGLTYLQAYGNRFTDAGVQPLAALVNLEHLHLEEETLSFAAFDFVDQLPRLRQLGLQDVPISDAELGELRARLPGVSVRR